MFARWFGPSTRETDLQQESESLRAYAEEARQLLEQRDQVIVELQQYLAQERAAHQETQRQLAAVYQSLEQGSRTSSSSMQAVSRPAESRSMGPSDPNDSTQTVDSSWLQSELDRLNR